MIVDDDDANAMVRTIHVAKIDDTLAGCRVAVAVRCQIRAECRAILARSPLCSLLRSNANQAFRDLADGQVHGRTRRRTAEGVDTQVRTPRRRTERGHLRRRSGVSTGPSSRPSRSACALHAGRQRPAAPAERSPVPMSLLRTREQHSGDAVRADRRAPEGSARWCTPHTFCWVTAQSSSPRII